MQSIRTQSCSLITAIAVLLVSVTCTSAGCLLQSKSSPSPAASHLRPCCAAHVKHSGNPSPVQPERRCPLCNNSVLIGKAVDNNHHDVTPSVYSLVFFVLPPPACFASQFQALAACTGAPPPGEPDTLLHLHCALLI